MKLTRIKHKLEATINIAPLIDIVLLLIVFCMTVTQLTKAHTEDLELPEGKQGIGLEDIEPQRLVVNVLKPDGKLMIRGMEYTMTMVAALLDESVESLRSGETTVVVRCDRSAPWSPVARLTQMCTDRNIFRVRVAVRDPNLD